MFILAIITIWVIALSCRLYPLTIQRAIPVSARPMAMVKGRPLCTCKMVSTISWWRGTNFSTLQKRPLISQTSAIVYLRSIKRCFLKFKFYNFRFLVFSTLSTGPRGKSSPFRSTGIAIGCTITTTNRVVFHSAWPIAYFGFINTSNGLARTAGRQSKHPHQKQGCGKRRFFIDGSHSCKV